MIKRCIEVLALLLLSGAAAAAVNGSAAKHEVDRYPAWRAAAARALANRGDADSLATAAALTFLGPPSRPRAQSAKAAEAALQLAVKASELKPDSPAISWLHLRLCTYAPDCDIRDAATTMRWVAADNGAAWLPTLTVAQKDRDTMEVDRVLASMAQGEHFNLYTNRTTVLMFDALTKVRGHLPANYVKSDLARLSEAMGLANAAVLPGFSPLINACREAGANGERRADCLSLAKIMQRADTIMAQLVGFAIEKRLTPPDGREARALMERRRVLEWRAATYQFEAPSLPLPGDADARSRLAKMRRLPREEDLCVALMREHKLPLDPPPEHPPPEQR